MNQFYSAFERFIWAFRLIILVAVVSSLVVAVCAVIVATTEVGHLLHGLAIFLFPQSPADKESAGNVLTPMVRSIDSYLLAAIMLVFSFGLYELFIGKIEIAEQSPVADRLLLIRSLDDLKDRLAKMVVLMLVIEYFQHALATPVRSMQDLLILAVGIMLLGGTLYLISRMQEHGGRPDARSESGEPKE